VGPRFQEAVHNSQGHLCTNFQPLTLCARLAMTSLVWAFCPGKHRPGAVPMSSPLAVTQKGQMSRMTKALQRLCMTPTAPTAPWHTSIALFTPPQHLCTPRDHRSTVVHDHSAYPHHHSAITHPGTPGALWLTPTALCRNLTSIWHIIFACAAELATPRNAPMLP